MELMTKYQYTYFIYPYVIEEKNYKKYLLGLLKNKKCKIRFFNQLKDIHLYTYFLPNIQDYMFWSFKLDSNGIRNFESCDVLLKATLLAEHECNIFNYELPENLQGKVEANNGIFFEISEIKIICFKSGICFLVFKTNIENSNNFSDVLNFNYKFREINSISYDLKEYENIKIQSNLFKDVKGISTLIKELTGNNELSKKANIGNEKFYVYSYVCIDQKDWNENTENDDLDNMFEKYRSVLPANSQIIDDNYLINGEYKEKKAIYKNQYIKYGFTPSSTVLFTSNINTTNFTIVPQNMRVNICIHIYWFYIKKCYLINLTMNSEKKQRITFWNLQKNFGYKILLMKNLDED